MGHGFLAILSTLDLGGKGFLGKGACFFVRCMIYLNILSMEALSVKGVGDVKRNWMVLVYSGK